MVELVRGLIFLDRLFQPAEAVRAKGRLTIGSPAVGGARDKGKEYKPPYQPTFYRLLQFLKEEPHARR